MKDDFITYQGDAYLVTLDYTVDGVPLVDSEIDEIEVYVGDKQYLLSRGDITIDDETGKYTLFVDQETTFKHSIYIPYQIRFKQGNEVVGEKIYKIPMDKSISRNII